MHCIDGDIVDQEDHKKKHQKYENLLNYIKMNIKIIFWIQNFLVDDMDDVKQNE